MLPDLSDHFPGATGYFNTATIGLPPAAAARALHDAIDQWQRGDATAPAYDRHVATARTEYAKLVGVPEAAVAIGAQVSALVGMVAAGLPPGSRVLCPEGEFTSVLFPFLARKDVEVILAPLKALPSRIDKDIDLVAFSLVQSADGSLADITGISEAAQTHGVRTLADATQAAGWLPFKASDFDVTVAGGYKWLLSPRGTAFMTVRDEALEQVSPVYAGWYAGEAPWDSIYGAPIRLAKDARRFDLSPAWLSWVGTAVALASINQHGIDAIHTHNVALANDFRQRLGLEASDSAIVSLATPSSAKAPLMDELKTSTRAGKLRVAFHLYNQPRDVERLTRALGF